MYVVYKGSEDRFLIKKKIHKNIFFTLLYPEHVLQNPFVSLRKKKLWHWTAMQKMNLPWVFSLGGGGGAR